MLLKVVNRVVVQSVTGSGDDRVEVDTLIDETLVNLNNSSEFLQSNDIDTFSDGSSSDTIDYEVNQNLSDIEESMPLIFVSKKYRKVYRGDKHNRLSVTTSTPRATQIEKKIQIKHNRLVVVDM